jgi:hypothetical protein
MNIIRGVALKQIVGFPGWVSRVNLCVYVRLQLFFFWVKNLCVYFIVVKGLILTFGIRVVIFFRGMPLWLRVMGL